MLILQKIFFYKLYTFCFSFNYKKNLSFGYISSDFSDEELAKKNLYIEVEKKKYPADLLLKPLKQTIFKKN